MKRVLIPIDGSACALRGVALVISKRALYLSPDDLEIHLVNVQAPFSNDVSRFVSPQQIAEFHRQESEQALQGARQMLDAAGVKYRCHSEVGHIAETITALADSLACDQIVMGTHGRGAFKEFVMGSIPLKVLALSSIPVLLIK
ncbi:MAG: UspA [Proteobacteria bacterium]|nr:UspA [Pseudomonadota bacterium]